MTVVETRSMVTGMEKVRAAFEARGHEVTTNNADFFVTTCPVEANHKGGDAHPSLHFREITNSEDPDDTTVFFKCWSGGCSPREILQAIGLQEDDLYSKPGAHKGLKSYLQSNDAKQALTLADFYLDKKLPLQFIMMEMQIHEDVLTFHTKEGAAYKKKGVVFPYLLPDGTPYVRYKLRVAMKKAKPRDNLFFWNEGDPEEPTNLMYGLHGLHNAKEQHHLMLVEGESDTCTNLYHRFPTLGISGGNNVEKSIETTLQLVPDLLEGIDTIYVSQEKTDQTGINFPYRVQVTLRKHGYKGQILRVPLRTLTGAKDPSDLHIKLWEQSEKPVSEKRLHEVYQAEMQKCLDQARPMDYDTAGNQTEIKQEVIDALEKEDVKTLFDLADQLVELDTTELALLKATIQSRMKTCELFSWSDFKKRLKEAERNKLQRKYADDAPADSIYRRTERGMFFKKESELGSFDVPLSNFSAEIIQDIITDDGAETARSYEIEAYIQRRKKTFEIPARDFSSCTWIDEQLGARATVTPGQSMKAHLINAIKECSEPQEAYLYAHTGWRKIDEQWGYLHSDGFLVSGESSESRANIQENRLDSQDKLNEPAYKASLVSSESSESSESTKNNILVRLSGDLINYRLSCCEQNAKQAIRASLAILDITEDVFTMPLYCSLWRAVLGNVDYAVHLAGESGLGKTELAALIQQHFGAEMDAKHLPGSWESSENSLEMLLFQAKDTVVVVDDFKPQGSRTDIDRLHKKADRVFRSIGNGSARGRLDRNLNQRAARAPRCMVISTGEDVPRGQSLKARAVVLLMDQCIVQGEALQRLEVAQSYARSSVYTVAMASYLAWLAPRIEELRRDMHQIVAEERKALQLGGHGRLSSNTAQMLIGLKFFLQFACEVGAISEEEAQNYQTRCITALRHIAEEATRENYQDKPSEQWRRLVVAAIANKSAHLVTEDGENPGDEYGWVKSVHPVAWTDTEGIIQTRNEETFRGGGLQIGWIVGDDIYLDPISAYKVAQAIGSPTGDTITTLESTLRKFLVQDKLLASTELGTARKTITVRRRFQGLQRKCLHIKKSKLFDEEVETPQNSVDSGDSVDSSPSEPAPQASAEVSQVDPKKEPESSSFVDSPTHQAKEIEILLQEVRVLFKKRRGMTQMWHDDKDNPQYYPQDYIAHVNDAIASGDPQRIQSAITAMKWTLGRLKPGRDSSDE